MYYTKDKNHVIRIRVNEDLIKYIDQYADDLNISRSEMVRFMLDVFKAENEICYALDTSYNHD